MISPRRNKKTEILRGQRKPDHKYSLRRQLASPLSPSSCASSRDGATVDHGVHVHGLGGAAAAGLQLAGAVQAAVVVGGAAATAAAAAKEPQPALPVGDEAAQSDGLQVSQAIACKMLTINCCSFDE